MSKSILLLVVSFGIRLFIYCWLVLLLDLRFRLPFVSSLTSNHLLLAAFIFFISCMTITRIDRTLLCALRKRAGGDILLLMLAVTYWIAMAIEWQLGLGGMLDQESFLFYELNMLVAGFPSSIVGVVLRILCDSLLLDLPVRVGALLVWAIYAAPFFVQLSLIWRLCGRRRA